MDGTNCQQNKCNIVQDDALFWTKLFKIRKLFHNRKFVLTALQPFNRSFSQPDLRPEIIENFKFFREFLANEKFTIDTLSSCSDKKVDSIKCDILSNASDESDRPVPMPRKSAQLRKQKIQNTSLGCNSTSASLQSVSKDDNLELPNIVDISESGCEVKQNNQVNSIVDNIIANNSHNENYSSCSTPNTSTPSTPREDFRAKTLDLIDEDSVDLVSFGSLFQRQNKLLSNEPSEYTPIPTVKVKVKTKHSFKSFLKINKIATNKFLSLRSSRKKPLLNIAEVNFYKPQRPTRSPPLPPILVFKPPAPLPEDDGDNFDFNSNNQVKTSEYSRETVGLDNDTISELYHDALCPDDDERIYCSVDEVMSRLETEEDTNLYHGISEMYADGAFSGNSSTNDGYDETPRDDYDYYDDGECIYEELSSNDETIYEEYIENENVYGNAETVDKSKSSNDDKKQQKRLKKIKKKMKRFNMNGDEIPVNAGIVKEHCRGSRNDLFVRKGETVLILRMEDNPPGKWLAKNERSKIGYVDLDNVYFDAESIKAVIKSFQNI